MKKAIVLLLALALIGGAAFAQDATISGYGQAKWGYNLNNDMHGFTNSYGLEVNLPLIDAATKSSTGEGVYGTASVTDLTVNIYLDAKDGTAIFDASDATVSAAIKAGDLTTTIYTQPSLSLNNASHFSPWKDDDADYSDYGIRFNPTVGGGLTFAYALGEMGTFTAKLASIGDATTYASDQYAFTGGIVLTPVELATVTLGGGYNLADKLMGATVKVALAPAEGITAYVAADLSKADAVDATFDGRFNVAAALGTLSIGADVNYAKAAADTLDGKFMLTSTETVPGLTASVGVYAMDLLADPANDPMVLGFADSISYKISLSETTYIKPYQKAAFDLSKADNKLYLSVGASAMFFANTTFTLDYTAGSLTNKAFPGAGFVATGNEEDLGKISLTAKITF